MRNPIQTPRDGFTLVELLIVIAIIGLIISLILVAAADGVRRAEERATQSLITKLETAINDRLDALLNTQAPINQTHRYLAAIGSIAGNGNSNSYDRRAQVIAQFDYIRAELPDVFFLNSLTTDKTTAAAQAYPLNFAAAPYPPRTNSSASFVLPLGNFTPGLPLININGNLSLSLSGNPVTGMFGASFSAAGGLYKNLYAAAAADLIKNNSSCQVNAVGGYDGVDNNGDGQIDELIPAGGASPEVIVLGSPDKPFATYVANRLQNHTHRTARAEVLYAILVEGLGPLGSAFNRDEFTNREVQDTDGDGLPEFVDAWGEPLQFYRWPIYYGTAPGSSDTQLVNRITAGFTSSNFPWDTTRTPSDNPFSYNGFSTTRQQDPLDPNQLLLSPAWWSGASNANPTLYGPPPFTFAEPGPGLNGRSNNQSGQAATAFMNYFHILVDPTPGVGNGWDRGGGSNRRAYYSRFLIISGGPDKEPGVAQLGKEYGSLIPSGSGNILPFPNEATTMEGNALLLTCIENQAAQFDPVNRQGSFYEVPPTPPSSSTPTETTFYLQGDAAIDDISNHNVSAPSTGVR